MTTPPHPPSLRTQSSKAAAAVSADESDVDRLFGLSPEVVKADDTDDTSTPPQRTKRRRREKAVAALDDASASPSTSPIHPFFLSPPNRADSRATAASRSSLPSPTTPSSSPSPSTSPLSSHSSSSSSSSSSPPPVLSDEQVERLLAPSPYWLLTRAQDFAQVMNGSSVTLHAPQRKSSASIPTSHCSPDPMPSPCSTSTAGESFVVIPRFALHDEGQHGPCISDHSVHKQRYDGYWEERLRKLAEQKPNADVYGNLPSYSPQPLLPPPHPSSRSTPQSALPPHPTSPALSPALFSGVCVYIDGRTGGSGVLSAYSLTALIRLHGGECSPVMSRTGTTHILACNLTLSKHRTEWEQRWGKRGLHGRRLMEVVRPEWIVDSIRAGRRLPESTYRLLHDRSQPVLPFG